jgi:hypothetical protein
MDAASSPPAGSLLWYDIKVFHTSAIAAVTLARTRAGSQQNSQIITIGSRPVFAGLLPVGVSYVPSLKKPRNRGRKLA